VRPVASVFFFSLFPKEAMTMQIDLMFHKPSKCLLQHYNIIFERTVDQSIDLIIILLLRTCQILNAGKIRSLAVDKVSENSVESAPGSPRPPRFFEILEPRPDLWISMQIFHNTLPVE
jgi:hypothetical protein